SGRPADVVGPTAPGLGLGEADVARADAEAAERMPGCPGGRRQGVLCLDQLLRRGRPATRGLVRGVVRQWGLTFLSPATATGGRALGRRLSTRLGRRGVGGLLLLPPEEDDPDQRRDERRFLVEQPHGNSFRLSEANPRRGCGTTPTPSLQPFVSGEGGSRGRGRRDLLP